MIYKKSVVLSSVKGGKEKGVLTLECDNGEIIGSVRLYNFNDEPSGILSVGILDGDKVLKAGLSSIGGLVYSFKINGERELKTFTCAVVNFVNGQATPLLLGACGGRVTGEERLCNSLCVFENEPTVKNVQNILDANDVYLEEQEEIDEIIDEHFCVNSNESGCNNCKYRDAFFKLGDDVKEPEPKEEMFYDDIKEQIEELFSKYPEDEILKQLIPDSKWVKIDYEEKNEYYVVGLLYENGQIKYVCYGVPSIVQDSPPEELKGLAQWLPIDVSKEKGFGYWLTYQDAKTGETIKMNYETI